MAEQPQQPQEGCLSHSSDATAYNPTYWGYLRLDKLLTAQNGVDEKEDDVSADELHFIIVHQTLELWFKLVLKQLRLARDELDSDKVTEEKVPYVVHHLKRVLEIFRVAADHFRIMETLTPQDFLAFRGKLGTASGFQSFQLREIEIVTGLDEKQLIQLAEGNALQSLKQHALKRCEGELGKLAISRIENAKNEVSLKDALEKWLFRTPIHGSTPDSLGDEAAVDEFLRQYLEAHKELYAKQVEVQVAAGVDSRERIKTRFDAVLESTKKFLFSEDVDEADRKRITRIRAGILFIESYRDLPLLSWPRALIDTVVEFEQGFIIFRQRHARMVERMIGRRVGTGGSSGLDYLEKTATYRIFPNLWQARTALLPKFAVPTLKNEKYYTFHNSQ